MRAVLRTAVILWAGHVVAAGQAAEERLSFDAASVRPATPPEGVSAAGNSITAPKESGIAIPRNTGGPGTSDPGRIHFPLISLKSLLQRAYDAEISGPGWLDTTFVQVDATMPPATTEPQFREMLRTLIDERFGLKQHREPRAAPGYELVAAKGRPKLSKSTAEPASTAVAPPRRSPLGADGFPTESRLPPGQAGLTIFLGQGGRYRLYAQGQTMEDLARALSFQLSQDAGPNAARIEIAEATGLTGKYDFTLTFAASWASADVPLPNLFAALPSQLGLRLERSRRTVEVVVVDQMARTPAEN